VSEAGALIKYFKSNGCIVLHKCTAIRHAKVRYLHFCCRVYCFSLALLEHGEVGR
jgi:hypothetical protein